MTYILKKIPCWQVKDLTYRVSGSIRESDKMLQMLLFETDIEEYDYGFDWEKLKERYGAEEVDALAAAFENYDVCPRSEEQLGEVWSPFHASIGLNESWRSYYKYKHEQQGRRGMCVQIEKCGCPDIGSLQSNCRESSVQCAYQGVYAGDVPVSYYSEDDYRGIFFWRMNGNLWYKLVESA